MKDALEIIRAHAKECAQTQTMLFTQHEELLHRCALHIALTLTAGGKILLAGNDTSASITEYMAGLFIHRLHINRPPLPALALTNKAFLHNTGHDQSTLPCFTRQIDAFGTKGDCLLLFAPSHEATLIAAAQKAAAQELTVISFTGTAIQELSQISHCILHLPATTAFFLQEAYLSVAHILCRLTDYYLFENAAALLHAQSLLSEKE